MARVDVKRIKERANEINSGWKQDGSGDKFMGITQSEYQTEIDAAAAKDQEILDALAHIEDLKAERDDMYRGINVKSVKIRDGVQGDAKYGDDSPLYGSMGFKRKSERASGLTKKKKQSK